MGPISLSTSIDAPRERVFDEISDLSRRTAWAGHFISDLHLEREDPSGRGAAARFKLRAPGGIGFMETVIDEAERPHLISERGRGGRWDRIPVRAAWELRGGERAPTEVTLTFWTEPSHLLDRVRELRAGHWWKRRWRKALRRLRAQLEGSEPAPPPVAVAGGERAPAGLA